jgi:hypothetical protein
MIYYKIFPACAQDLFLTLNLDINNSAVLLKDLAQDKDRQLWTPIEIVSGGMDKGFALLNKYDYKVIARKSEDGDRKSLTQISPSDMSKNSATWTYLPVSKYTDFGAIQLKDNQNMNLNAFGNDTWKEGNTVGIHDWNEGATNEVWRLIRMDA